MVDALSKLCSPFLRKATPHSLLQLASGVFPQNEFQQLLPKWAR